MDLQSRIYTQTSFQFQISIHQATSSNPSSLRSPIAPANGNTLGRGIFRRCSFLGAKTPTKEAKIYPRTRLRRRILVTTNQQLAKLNSLSLYPPYTLTRCLISIQIFENAYFLPTFKAATGKLQSEKRYVSASRAFSLHTNKCNLYHRIPREESGSPLVPNAKINWLFAPSHAIRER